jgi:hypothetical protein
MIMNANRNIEKWLKKAKYSLSIQIHKKRIIRQDMEEMKEINQNHMENSEIEADNEYIGRLYQQKEWK